MSKEEDSLFDMLEQEMISLPCDVDEHDTSPMHSGKGEWYLTISCPVCKSYAKTSLICDRYHSLFQSIMILYGASVVECPECRENYMYRETLVESIRKEP